MAKKKCCHKIYKKGSCCSRCPLADSEKEAVKAKKKKKNKKNKKKKDKKKKGKKAKK